MSGDVKRRRWWQLRRRSEKRAISFQDVWGTGADVDSVRGGSIGTALTLAPVFAATRLIADSIASLPLQAYRKTGDQRQPIATPKLLANPSIFGGPYEWVQRALVSLLLRGNAYGLITSVDANGWPQQVEWLHPDEVTIADNRAISRPQWYWLGRPVSPWLGRDSAGELLHIPWYVLPGEILGLSPIRAFATTIETGILTHRFGRNFFGADAVPSAVLETDQPVDEPQAAIIKERFRQAARSREPVVLGAGTAYKAITVPPEESQFLETIKATATEIASIYGLRPERVGGQSGSSMTYANVEHQAIADLHDVRPYITKLETHLSTLLPRPQYARFNFDALLRADTKTRYEAHAIALNEKSGWMTKDEVRELEELQPIPEDQLPTASGAPAPTQTEDPDDDQRGRLIPLPPRAAYE